MKKVMLGKSFQGEFREVLTSLVGDIVEFTETPAEAEVFIQDALSPEFLAQLNQLDTVIIPWAGVPSRTREALLSRPGIRCYNLHHNARATGEMAVALYLAASRGYVQRHERMRAADWSEPQGWGFRCVYGQRVLVLGAGAIGRHVAKGLRGLDAEPILMARSAREGVEPVAKLSDWLPRVDGVICTLPATPETEGLLGRESLSALLRGAVVVNVGRGKVIDAKALYDLLASRHLRGAGLDVWWDYPRDRSQPVAHPPAGEVPLHELPNVVMTPHIGGDTDERERAEACFAVLQAVAAGEDHPWRVDLTRGY